jgi:DNA anti-recombination protein RmuC
LVFWTENGIRKVAAEVAADVLSGGRGAEITRNHISDVLRGTVAAEVDGELRAAAEKLAENAKASLHRKLNGIYTTQCEKLEQNVKRFEQEVDNREPDLKRRLDRLERQLSDLERSCEEWLEAPKQQLERAAAKNQQLFSAELAKLTKNSATRMTGMITRVEQQMVNLIHEKLHELLVEIVRQHVRSTPFAPESLSNKQIAAARQISLRQVKRLRRMNLA